SAFDTAQAIAVDSSGNAYVTGTTGSTDFPTMSPLQGALRGLVDAFVTKLNVSGTALVYSTYLGGGDFDFGNGIALDSAGNAFVTGGTRSTDFPAADPLLIGGNQDCFVAKLNAAGAAVTFSTYLGGSEDESVTGIARDGCGRVSVVGRTFSADFP